MSTQSHRRTKPQRLVSLPTELLWAVIGLLLTIISTFVEAYVTNPPWQWANQGVQTQSLGITYQIGAVLLIGCTGGRNAAVLSQIAYLILGLFWLPIFAHGGGLDYINKPSFGYLLGFIPGAWLCGWLAFRQRPKVEFLGLSALGGLLVIHSSGLLYILWLFFFKPENFLVRNSEALWSLIQTYSVTPFPSQLVLICVVSVLGFMLRKLLLY
ncbi:MAG: biotin transporter BioY [Microcystaceae cyanobacterium]